MANKEHIDWHPAFVAAMKLELKNYENYLKYIEEYQLTDEPLRIDVIVLNEDKIKIEKQVARIFKKYNIMEYKSPTDYLSIDDFYKVIAYAYLFKGIEGQKSKGKNKIDSVKIRV